MSRHIADRREPAGAAKTRAFLDIARRDAGPHPATQALLKKPRNDVEDSRMKEYLRIERGHLA